MHLRKHWWQQSVARHREKDARLAELKHEQHRRVCDNRTKRDNAGGPIRSWRDVLQRHRQRLGLLGRQSLYELRVGNQPVKTAATTT